MKYDVDLGRIREDLRGVSKRVFSKQHRLEAVALIGAQNPPIWSRRLARALGIGENQAASEIANLAGIGALQRFPAEHDRRKIYQPVPHAIWAFSRELLEDTIAASYPDDVAEASSKYWQSVLDQPELAPIPGGRD